MLPSAGACAPERRGAPPLHERVQAPGGPNMEALSRTTRHEPQRARRWPTRRMFDGEEGAARHRPHLVGHPGGLPHPGVPVPPPLARVRRGRGRLRAVVDKTLELKTVDKQRRETPPGPSPPPSGSSAPAPVPPSCARQAPGRCARSASSSTARGCGWPSLGGDGAPILDTSLTPFGGRVAVARLWRHIGCACSTTTSTAPGPSRPAPRSST